MSLLPGLTFSAPGVPLYGGGGGGGSTSNIVASTITLTGSADPLEITLPASANDGFSVRQGGASNALAILTIDTANLGQAEFGIRTLSTIAGNPVPRGRFEMNVIPSTDSAKLVYGLDTVGSGNASTIGGITFLPGNGSNIAGSVTIFSENGGGGAASLQVRDYQVTGNSAACLNPRSFTPTTNIYVPAGGATQTVASFSTVTGHMYELHIPNLRVQNEPAGVPQPNAWTQLVVDAAAQLDTFDMASVNAVANDLQTSRSYSFLAAAGGHNLQAIGNLSNTLSTALTFPLPCLLRDLGFAPDTAAANAAP